MEQPDYLRTIRARGKWLGGRVNDLYVRAFPMMRSDELPAFGTTKARIRDPHRLRSRSQGFVPEQAFLRPGWLKK